MNEQIDLLIPNRLPEQIRDKERDQRYASTLLLLKALYPEGRFRVDAMKTVSVQCGFDSQKGFEKGHLQNLIAMGLAKYENHAAHKTRYVVLAGWPQIKKHFKYATNHFTPFKISIYSSHVVMALLITLDVKAEQSYHHSCFRANLNGNPELKEAIETVCGDLSRSAIHHYQLETFTEGIPPGKSDEYYYAAYVLLHATKEPKAAREGDKTSRRFYIKADTNISVGHLSRTRGYKNRNGMCYWKKELQRLGLVKCNRREYVIESGVRTKTKDRITGIGNTYWDAKEGLLKLRLVDEWIFFNPEVVLNPIAPKTESNSEKSVANG